MSRQSIELPQLSVFSPPYTALEPIQIGWVPQALPPRGDAIIWRLSDSARQEEEFDWLGSRPVGLPLIVVLPPVREISRALPLLGYIPTLDPKVILPSGRIVAPPRLRDLLGAPPRQLPRMVVGYLSRRQLLTTDTIRRDVRRIFELAPDTRSIAKLAQQASTSRRTLGRRFADLGLPVPSHWLQFARLLHVAVRLQNERTAAFRIAARFGYPDGFTMSNQMKRLLDARPTEIRQCLGWEWIVEAWLAQETRTGGLDSDLHREAVSMYV